MIRILARKFLSFKALLSSQGNGEAKKGGVDKILAHDWDLCC